MKALQIHQVENLIERVTCDPIAQSVMPAALATLYDAVSALETPFLRAFDAYLTEETPATRQAWRTARDASTRATTAFAEAYNDWAAARADAVCARCGYFTLTGTVCAGCLEGQLAR